MENEIGQEYVPETKPYAPIVASAPILAATPTITPVTPIATPTMTPVVAPTLTPTRSAITAETSSKSDFPELFDSFA